MSRKPLTSRVKAAWTVLRSGGLLVVGLSAGEEKMVRRLVRSFQDIETATRRLHKANTEMREVEDRILYPHDLCEPEEDVFV